MIEEGFYFVHEDVVFYLTRLYRIPTAQDESGKPKYNDTLPSFEDLKLFDLANKWTLKAEVRVLNGSDQKLMESAITQLLERKGR